jgi:hypothetical protein
MLCGPRLGLRHGVIAMDSEKEEENRSGRPAPRVVKGMEPVQLSQNEFRERFLARFYDPAFDKATEHVEALLRIAWDAYSQYRKSPRTRRAGQEFSDPDYELPVEWLNTQQAVRAAAQIQKDPSSPSRVLVINASSRSDQTCPGEMSKTYRLAKIAATIKEQQGFEVDFLDLSRLAFEYGRIIYPCKACVSTAMPLCHWPCSCYPNHALGQVGDWMNELYPPVDGGARGADLQPGLLVSSIERPQAHAGSAGLRRRRQPGSDIHGWKGSGAGKSVGTGGMGLSEAPVRPRLFGRRAR